MLDRGTYSASKIFLMCIFAAGSAQATDVFVDFGTPSVESPAGWNDARALYMPGSVSLETSAGASTGYTLTTTKRFTDHQPYGTLTPGAGIPLAAARDGMYGNETEYQGYFSPTGEMKLTGLNPAVTYNFSIFAAVDKNDTFNRMTTYDVIGATTVSKSLNPTNNTSVYATASVKPTSAGAITLVVRAGVGNNSADHFYHIAHFKMNYTLPAANTPPNVSVAASPSVITLPTNQLTLTATASDPGGSVASYAWSKVSGGAATIAKPTLNSTLVSGLAAGSYTFKVRVVDNLGAATEKSIAFTVNPASGSASAPVFNLVNYGSASPQYGYVEYLPRGYNQAAAASLPLIIFLHGIGERGQGIRDPNAPASFPITVADGAFGTQTYSGGAYLNKLLMFGPNAYIRNGDHDLPFVILSIQQFKTTAYLDWKPEVIDDFVDYAIAKYKVNPARIHVTGLSLGGGGSLHYAYLHPSRIASLVTICPGYYNQSTSALIGTLVDQNVAVWAAHAYNDHDANFNSRSRKLMNHMATEIGGTSSDLIHFLTRTPGSLDYVDPEELNMASYMDNVSTTHTANYDKVNRKWVWKTGQDPNTPAGYYPVTFTFYTNYPVLADTAANAAGRQVPHRIWTRIYDDPALYTWMLGKYR